MKQYLLAGLVCLGVWGGTAWGDEKGALMREIVAKHGEAVVSVRMAIKETMSMAEYGSEVSEYTQEIPATVILPGGLMVTSLMQLDPSAMMDSFYFDDEDGFDAKTEVTALHVLRGSAEVAAEIVLRDADLDLAFLRPVEKPEAPWAHVDLAADGDVEAFDPIYLLARMGKVVKRLPTVQDTRIAGIIEKPRKLYVIGNYMGSGTPAFSAPGACLGINVTRSLKIQANTGMGFTSGFESNMASIVVPGPDILELLEQVPPYEGKN